MVPASVIGFQKFDSFEYDPLRVFGATFVPLRQSNDTRRRVKRPLVAYLCRLIMSRSEIESKIYGVADSFRRESEEAHRQKDLALERLRLSQEEVAVAKQSSATLKAKLEELKKESGTTATREIQQLKGEVADFTNQVSRG